MNALPTAESTKRDDVPATALILADGTAWGFARPTTRLVPSVVAGRDSSGRLTETIALQVEFGYPLGIQRLVHAVRIACAAGSHSEQYEAFFALAVGLLVRVHDIDRATACALLSVTDAELPQLVTDVMAIVSDRQPEPVPAEPEEATHE